MNCSELHLNAPGEVFWREETNQIPILGWGSRRIRRAIGSEAPEGGRQARG